MLPRWFFPPPTVNVSVQEGDGPTFQAIDLDTSDGSAANYTITDDASWLSVLPTSGVTPGTVTATIDPTGVAAGIYMATITATAGSYIADTVAVTLTVTSAGSAYDLLLSDSPDRSGAALLDGATVSGSMYVFAGPESGVTRVSFFIDDPQMNGLPTKVENLAPYDLGGTDNSLLALPFNSAQLADGAHSLTALLALSDGSSEVLAAGFSVANNTPEMVFSTPTVNVSVQEGDGPTFQAIDLDTSDGSAANYTITDDASWLSVLPTSGVTPGTVTATIDPTGVAAGIYMATITATAGSYIADTVAVTLTVTSAGSAYDLLLSDSPDRSGAVLLDGTTVPATSMCLRVRNPVSRG